MILILTLYLNYFELTQKCNTILKNPIPESYWFGDLFNIKAALALYVFLWKPQKATIYNSGLPQDSRHFYKMPRDLPLRQSSECMGGDLRAVVTGESRRPRASEYLAKVGSRPVQRATPAFQTTTGLPRAHRRSSGVLSTILGKSLDTWLSPANPPTARRKPTFVGSTHGAFNVKRHSSSSDCKQIERRRLSITRCRSN